MLSAEATEQMTGWWENPLGIGSKVKVGPNLWLSISIIYAQSITTETPKYVPIMSTVIRSYSLF